MYRVPIYLQIGKIRNNRSVKAICCAQHTRGIQATRSVIKATHSHYCVESKKGEQEKITQSSIMSRDKKQTYQPTKPPKSYNEFCIDRTT